MEVSHSPWMLCFWNSDCCKTTLTCDLWSCDYCSPFVFVACRFNVTPFKACSFELMTCYWWTNQKISCESFVWYRSECFSVVSTTIKYMYTHFHKLIYYVKRSWRVLNGVSLDPSNGERDERANFINWP